jgi:hypothetical protein
MPNSAILSGITIVVVEDYSDSLYAIAQFLTRHGAKVFPNPDALEGVQTVREHRYLEDCSRQVIQRELDTRRDSTWAQGTSPQRVYRESYSPCASYGQILDSLPSAVVRLNFVRLRVPLQFGNKAPIDSAVEFQQNIGARDLAAILSERSL